MARRVKRKSLGRARRRAVRRHYYTVIIPFVGKGATRWHPTESVGAFSQLSRGAFATKHAAHAWARSNLGGHRYRLKKMRSY